MYVKTFSYKLNNNYIRYYTSSGASRLVAASVFNESVVNRYIEVAKAKFSGKIDDGSVEVMTAAADNELTYTVVFKTLSAEDFQKLSPSDFIAGGAVPPSEPDVPGPGDSSAGESDTPVKKQYTYTVTGGLQCAANSAYLLEGVKVLVKDHPECYALSDSAGQYTIHCDGVEFDKGSVCVSQSEMCCGLDPSTGINFPSDIAEKMRFDSMSGELSDLVIEDLWLYPNESYDLWVNECRIFVCVIDSESRETVVKPGAKAQLRNAYGSSDNMPVYSLDNGCAVFNNNDLYIVTHGAQYPEVDGFEILVSAPGYVSKVVKCAPNDIYVSSSNPVPRACYFHPYYLGPVLLEKE